MNICIVGAGEIGGLLGARLDLVMNDPALVELTASCNERRHAFG